MTKVTDYRTALIELCRVLEENYQRELFTDTDLAVAHRAARIALVQVEQDA